MIERVTGNEIRLAPDCALAPTQPVLTKYAGTLCSFIFSFNNSA